MGALLPEKARIEAGAAPGRCAAMWGNVPGSSTCPPLEGSDQVPGMYLSQKCSPKGPPSCLTVSLDSAVFNEPLVSDTLVSDSEATC